LAHAATPHAARKFGAPEVRAPPPEAELEAMNAMLLTMKAAQAEYAHFSQEQARRTFERAHAAAGSSPLPRAPPRRWTASSRLQPWRPTRRASRSPSSRSKVRGSVAVRGPRNVR
jgi:hypothetical protein